MTTATLSLRVQKNLQAKINSVDLPVINWKAVCITGFFAVMALSVFYVWQVNDLARGAYLVNTYGNQIKNLSNENKNLEVSFAESGFLGQAMEKIQSLNFQKTASVKYIQVLDSSAQVLPANKNI